MKSKQKSSIKLMIIFFVLTLTLTACQPTAEQIAIPVAETLAAVPTQTAYPTHTPENTYTPYPTYTIVPTYTPWVKTEIVTPTFTSTPEYTPTITETPTTTPTITSTPDKTRTDKKYGFYLVGSEISPGVWRSTGNTDNCYWEISTATGNIISNHYGMAGGTMYIPASAFQVRVEQECGIWTFLNP